MVVYLQFILSSNQVITSPLYNIYRSKDLSNIVYSNALKLFIEKDWILPKKEKNWPFLYDGSWHWLDFLLDSNNYNLFWMERKETEIIAGTDMNLVSEVEMLYYNVLKILIDPEL